MILHGDFVSRVGQSWDRRWPQRALTPPKDAQRLSRSAMRRLVTVELAVDVLVVFLLLVALFLGWAAMTRLLLAVVPIRAFTGCLVWAVVKRTVNSDPSRQGAVGGGSEADGPGVSAYVPIPPWPPLRTATQSKKASPSNGTPAPSRSARHAGWVQIVWVGAVESCARVAATTTIASALGGSVAEQKQHWCISPGWHWLQPNGCAHRCDYRVTR